MSVQTPPDQLTIALIGNPNTGKSTLFNALAGVRQRVGNYPGVTVEKKVGQFKYEGRQFSMIDLPGTYSLAPRSPDEMIAVDVLLGRQSDTATPNAVLCIVDASNLERNLYLLSQVLETRLPTVVALNMSDLAAEKGMTIDVEKLSQQLGVPVIPTQANTRSGIGEVKQKLSELVANDTAARPEISVFPPEFQTEVAKLDERICAQNPEGLPRYLVERLLLDTGGYLDRAPLPGVTPEVREFVKEARTRLAEAGHPVPGVEAIARYAWVGQILDGVVTRTEQEQRVSLSDRIDRVVTHRVFGVLIFIAIMLLMFVSIFSPLATVPMDWIEVAVGTLGDWAAGLIPPGMLQSLVVDGIIAGVGSVIVFLPQIFYLFFFIAILEDCGYMARAAYLMDKLFSRIGLSGKSFIPLLSSFACAIPGIMATRIIENSRDRLVTILIAPLMSCSARLPVYVLLVSAFIPSTYLLGFFPLQAAVYVLMYSLGAIVAVMVAWTLKKTILPGSTPAFVMELPSYKIPSITTVLHRMFERGWAFIRRAGTLIFAVSIVIWAAAYFPRNPETVEGPYQDQIAQLEARQAELPEDAEEHAEIQAQLDAIDKQIQGAYMKQSFLGQAGQWVEPIVKPLGWDWKIGCAAIASFPAREVVIGVLGVLYNLGDEADETSQPLKEKLRQATWEDSEEKVFNIPVALSIMVFFALCAQCAATLAIIKRETNSWRWPIFAFAYMTGLAYLGAFVTYQVGMMLIG